MSPRSPRVLLSTKGGQMAEVATADVPVAPIDEMDPIHGGVARRARATLGVTAWGMQVLTLPPNWEDYPNHRPGAVPPDPARARRGPPDRTRRQARVVRRPVVDGARRAAARGVASWPWSCSRQLQPATSRRSSN